MPLRYAVDLTRAAVYHGLPGYHEAVTTAPWLDVAVTGGMAAVLLAAGAALFSYRERTR